MAVVAFPFTCITSEDLEEDNERPVVSFGGTLSTTTSNNNNNNNNADNTTSYAQDTMDWDASNADSDDDDDDVPSLADGDLAVEEPNLQDEEQPVVLEKNEEAVDDDQNMIDSAFLDELSDKDGAEKDDNNDQNQAEPNLADNNVNSSTEEVAVNSMDKLLDEDATIEDTTAISPTTLTTANNNTFGGLSNLGNTCYMASALQMVASLDQFAELLHNNPVPEQASSNNDDDKGQLRTVLLQVMETLAEGQTVTPTEFKRILDERTPLFVGYRQQDSHEFLTTLFDLLDEAYQVSPPPPNQEDEKESAVESKEETVDAKEENSTEIAKANDEGEESWEVIQTEEATAVEADQTSETCPDETHTPEELAEESNSAMDDESDRPESYESVTKKPRNVEKPSNTPPMSPPSFTDLKPDGIEKLLYANLLVDEQPPSSNATMSSSSPPRCKLIGGRMAASDVNNHEMFTTDMDEDTATAAMCMACDNTEEDDDDAECKKSISPVESYLKTEVRMRLTCDSCKYTRAHKESFFHLSLEIGSDTTTVVEGLRKFFSPEKREVKCEKCFCETAMQTMEITRLPRALLLHFKRFIVDVSDDYTSITYRKNQSDVLFEDRLELQEDLGGVLGEFFADDLSMPLSDSDADMDDIMRNYKIRSVVNHIGSSAACGHYTADAARLSQSGERQWHRFNDSYVSQISANVAIKESSKTAYMVMYETS